MTERERLKELLKYALRIDNQNPGYIADYLLAHEVGFIPLGRNLTENHPVDEFVCSECGFICEDYTEKVYDIDGEYSYNCECEFDYCPKCGSKIDNWWREN